MKQTDFMGKWIDRFGSFWDNQQGEYPQQPYNPDRIQNLDS